MVIAAFWKYWSIGRKPCKEERAQELLKTIELLRQWDRVVEDAGVLYHKSWDRKEGQVRQLILPQVQQGGGSTTDARWAWTSRHRKDLQFSAK